MNMYRYIRNTLRSNDPLKRESVLRLLTKRAVKSTSRSNGAHLSQNTLLKMIGAFDTDDQFRSMIPEMEIYAAQYVRKAPKGAARLLLCLELIRQRADRYECPRSTVEEIFTRHQVAFNANGDQVFFRNVLSRYGVRLADCGHVSEDLIQLRGNDATFNHVSTVCPTCAGNLEGRIRAYNDSVYVLESYQARAMSYNNRPIIIDNRDPEYRYDANRDLWHHRSWSPYTNLIGDYHSSKRRGFSVIESPWFRSNRRAFGCELEVQVTSGEVNAAAGRVHEKLNPSLEVGEYCFFERDGSIGTGFEMVTQPAGLDVHRAKFALWLQDKEVKRGTRSHEGGSCGFHVHVGREYVTQSQIYRMQAFLNDPLNESLIKKIARRYSNGYSRIKTEMAKLTPNGKQSRDRYEALNVTGDHTIEFRIFRGSLRYESIIAALEFVNALVEFCTPGAVSILDFNAAGFEKFVTHPDNRTDTKYLRSYLALDVHTDDEQRIAA